MFEEILDVVKKAEHNFDFSKMLLMRKPTLKFCVKEYLVYESRKGNVGDVSAPTTYSFDNPLVEIQTRFVQDCDFNFVFKNGESTGLPLS